MKLGLKHLDALVSIWFWIVWLHQAMGGVSESIRVFHQRLIDCRWLNWEDHVQTSHRFSMYRKFNSILHCTKTYITMNMDKHLKCIMTKIRNHTEEDFICPFCKERKEDELHFVFILPCVG